MHQFSTIFEANLANIRTTRNIRTIRVIRQKLFDIRASTIPTRIGNPSTKKNAPKLRKGAQGAYVHLLRR